MLTYSSIVHFRKLLFVIMLVNLASKPIFNIIILNFISLAMMIVMGYTESLKNKSDNQKDLANEGFILVYTYHMYIFTDFVPDLSARTAVGKALIYFSMMSLAINFTVSINRT